MKKLCFAVLFACSTEQTQLDPIDIVTSADAAPGSAMDAGACRSKLTDRLDQLAVERCDSAYVECVDCAAGRCFCLGACPDMPMPTMRDCVLEHLSCCQAEPYDCPTYSTLREIVDENPHYQVTPLCDPGD